MLVSNGIGAVSRTMLDAEEVLAVEQAHPQGLTSAAIVDAFVGRGIRFSEATLRKYVQLGLLPRSHRVGSKGKHKGSKGIYPVGMVRQINEIRRMMSENYTIEDIRRRFAFVGGEIEELRRLLGRVLERLEESAGAESTGDFVTIGVKRQIEDARRCAGELLELVEAAARRLSEQARAARDAV
jgi:hypothetical protein